jgi:hypothetical protein
MSIENKNQKDLLERQIANLEKLLPGGYSLAEFRKLTTVKTIRRTIGSPTSVGCDIRFTPRADSAEQVIDLGFAIPARARVVDICLFTDAQFTGAITLVAEVGSTSSGAEYIGSATIYELNAVIAETNAGAFIATPSAIATSVFVSVTPGANWSLMTAGKVSVYITYIDVSDL